MTNIEILANSSRIQKIEDIFYNLELIFDLLKEDVIRIIQKFGGYKDDLFEEKYAEAKIWTTKQLNKHHLKLYQRIYTCKSVKQAIKLLIARITNNVRNQFNSNRKDTVAYWSVREKDTFYENVLLEMNANDPLEILLDEEMQILLDEDKQENLTNYKNEIIKIMKVEKNKNNHFQLSLNF